MTYEEYIQYCLPFLLGEKQHRTHPIYGDFIHYGDRLIFSNYDETSRYAVDIMISNNLQFELITLFDCIKISDTILDFLKTSYNSIRIVPNLNIQKIINESAPPHNLSL